MRTYHIMTVLINHRRDTAKEVQEQLTKHGCSIKVRLGLHEVDSECAEDGLVVLQLTGEEKEMEALKVGLNALDGVKASLTHMKSD